MAESYGLPEQHWFAHDFCVFLYNEIVDRLRRAEDGGILAVPYQPESESEARALSSLEGEEIWEWFESRGKDETVYRMIMCRVAPAVIADFCLFTNEALSCSKRVKITVAYALLRKPFRENLLYLEWLLADPQDFVDAFRSGSPKRISLGAFDEKKKRQTVERAMSQTPTFREFPSDVLYDLRYSKAASFGFEVLWNQALHLVTTRGQVATSPENLNFVFSDDASFLSQWNHLYKTLPTLLQYSAEIVAALFSKLGQPESEKLTGHDLRKLTGLRILADRNAKDATADRPTEGDDLRVPCVGCESFFLLSEDFWEPLFYKSAVSCPNCSRSLSADELIDPLGAR